MYESCFCTNMGLQQLLLAGEVLDSWCAYMCREWQRRRRLLDRDHDEALGKLESLPAADDVNDSFILLVSALCSGDPPACFCALLDSLVLHLFRPE